MKTEQQFLQEIRKNYGATLVAAAVQYKLRPEVLAGIMMRESRGGDALHPKGPTGIGDGGHACGLMQIDKRWFQAFCESEDWKDASKNIHKGAEILREKCDWLSRRTSTLGLHADSEIERAAIAAYNCGQGNVLRALVNGKGIDFYTAGHNYSAEVLRLAEMYRALEEVV